MHRSHFHIPSSNTYNEPVGKGKGGESFKRENYSEHGRRLSEQVQVLKNRLTNIVDSEYSENVYAKIETPEDVKIQGIKKELDYLGIQILSVDPNNNSIGHAYFNKNRFQEIENKIHDYASSSNNPLKSYLKVIESITPMESIDKLRVNLDSGDSAKISFVLNLQNEVSEEKADLLIGMFKEKFHLTTKIDKYFFGNNFKTIAIEVDKNDITSICEGYSLIQSVNLNPRTIITSSIKSDLVNSELKVNFDIENPTVIVIDSGVTNGGLLKGIVTHARQSLPTGALAPHYNHGTFVASRISFGDDVDKFVAKGEVESLCNIIDIAVFGDVKFPDGNFYNIGPDRLTLCSILQSTVDTFKDKSRVINLSLGENIPINDYDYSQTASLIDELSRIHDIIFVIASGNIREPLGNFPSDHFNSNNARICSPAESVLGITVGSISMHEDTIALSKKYQISPFSRIGPGFNRGLKPELVHHGGNLLNDYSEYNRIATSGLFQSGIHLATDNGTSFSAPLVSQIAARLFAFYEGRSSNLIKSLLFHYTDRALPHNVLGLDERCQVGFGIPNFLKAISAGNYSASYLYEGKVKNDYFHIIKFYIPSMLASDNKDSKLKIKVTVVSNPPVNFTDISQYVQSKLTVSLDKLNSSNVKKKATLDKNDKTGSNWSPIQQFEKTFTRSYVTGEWELKVRCWTRGDLPVDFEQDFAVVIEIIDEMGNGDPYQGILNETGTTYFTRIISIDRAA